MDLSPTMFSSHDVDTLMWRQLGKVDFVRATRVCTVWRTVITGKNMESYWKEALQFIAKPIEGCSSFQLFAQSISQAFKVYHKGIRAPYSLQHSLKWESTIPKEMNINSSIFGYRDQEDEVKRIEKKWLEEALPAAIILYHADLFDFSVLERHVDTLYKSHGNDKCINQVAWAEYNKAGQVDFAKQRLAKLTFTSVLKNQLLELIVRKLLAMKDFDGAMAAVKSHRDPSNRCFESFCTILDLIRDAAYESQRLDIAEQLLDLIPRGERFIWVDLLIQSHKDAGNEAEALRIIMKFPSNLSY